MMKTTSRNKLYRDQNLFKDIGFLMLATAFVLMQAFHLPLGELVMYTPMIVLGGFGGLVALGYVAVALLRLLEAFEVRMGFRRGARS